MKKISLLITLAAVALVGLSACGSGEKSASSDSSEKDKKELVVNKDKKEIMFDATVNGTYFSEPTRHLVVYEGGANGEKSILRGQTDEKKVYQALKDIGAESGDNLTAKDMKADYKDGKKIDGDKVTVFLKWKGHDEIPAREAIKSDKDYTPDFRFGGNLASAKKNNTGCVICLDSCATGIVSDAAWPVGTTEQKVNNFYGNKKVLPKDGTTVQVIIRLAQ